ncbi:histone H1E-like isoform X3 [Bradysia coprophila]|uniref:histone H1E-like isoform X2 n=1 Tax=Bradysia coprophila TaxID=38358 RepID=UPI00187DB90C|nr:histone H1E-like isoform X2 [Bradysia coprophila]XP_037037737.1 histone H1E-like isoform X3 [Bradysia coprophila]
MADLVVPTVPSLKKVAPKTASKHPPTAEMVNVAIETLNDRGGSSLYAIKKYISAAYTLDIEKLSTLIKKYLKSAVASGDIKQTKGKGASGSFKLGATASERKKAAAKKSKHVTGEEKAKAKKASAEKKPAAESSEKKKASAPAKAATPKKAAKSPKQKSTKPTAAATKAKAPKPKKAASTAKMVTPKKVAKPKKK